MPLLSGALPRSAPPQQNTSFAHLYILRMSIFSVLCILLGLLTHTAFFVPPTESPSAMPETQHGLSKLLFNAHNLAQLSFSQGATTPFIPVVFSPSPSQRRADNAEFHHDCSSCQVIQTFTEAQDSHKHCICLKLLIVLSHLGVSDSATTWIVALKAPLSLGFSRQEYWSRLLFPTPGDPADRDQTCVSYISCIDRKILYHCDTWEAPQISHYIGLFSPKSFFLQVTTKMFFFLFSFASSK